MSYVLLFFLSWAVFYLFIDFERTPELYPSGLLSSTLGIWTDLIMVRFKLWDYNGAPLDTLSIPLVLDFSIYPVVAMLYVQYFPHRKPLLRKTVYILFWVLPAIFLEWIYLMRGEMQHHKWWSLWLSFFSDWIIYAILIGAFMIVRNHLKQNQAR